MQQSLPAPNGIPPHAPTLNTYQRAILFALNRTGKHVFRGIESPAERTARRRADRAEVALLAPGRPGRRMAARLVRMHNRVQRRGVAA